MEEFLWSLVRLFGFICAASLGLMIAAVGAGYATPTHHLLVINIVSTTGEIAILWALIFYKPLRQWIGIKGFPKTRRN